VAKENTEKEEPTIPTPPYLNYGTEQQKEIPSPPYLGNTRRRTDGRYSSNYVFGISPTPPKNGGSGSSGGPPFF
jgi:hypothetical protein